MALCVFFLFFLFFYVSKEPRKENCFRCPIGRYATDYASTECVECGSGMITAESGSESKEQCLCAEGRFWTPQLGCMDCLEGMICSEGLGAPQQREGYWAEVIDAEMGLQLGGDHIRTLSCFSTK